MRILPALVLALIVAFSSPAAASGVDDMDFCICRNVLSRMLCKDVDEFNLVGKIRDGLYLYSVFYANKEQKFYCGVGSQFVKVQGLEKMKITRSIPYTFDPESNCGALDFDSSDCPKYSRVTCCAKKDAEARKADQFWDKPIPQLLEEDLREALKQDANASQGQ